MPIKNLTPLGVITLLTFAAICILIYLRNESPIGSKLSVTQSNEDKKYIPEGNLLGQTDSNLTNRNAKSKFDDTDNSIAQLAIDNINCIIFHGKSESSDIGVVILPDGESAEFAVLDATGTRFSGNVPFKPNNVRIGKRDDGSILVGLADLRLNSKSYRSVETSQPVQIFQNGQVIFESDRVWDFDVAADGSSFVIHEPAPSMSSRLIIRNIDDGKEVHFDLGGALTPADEYEMSHMMTYSHDNSEIVFAPAHADANGSGVYWFYPVGSGSTQQITVEDVASAILTSSSGGYIIDYVEDEDYSDSIARWEVSRRQFNSDTRTFKPIWNRELKFRHSPHCFSDETTHAERGILANFALK